MLVIDYLFVQKLIRALVSQNRRRDMIDDICGCKYTITPKIDRYL